MFAIWSTYLSLKWQDEVKRTGETGVEETILEGHLGVTKELLAFQTPEKKYHIGCEKGGANLIKVSSSFLISGGDFLSL